MATDRRRLLHRLPRLFAATLLAACGDAAAPAVDPDGTHVADTRPAGDDAKDAVDASDDQDVADHEDAGPTPFVAPALAPQCASTFLAENVEVDPFLPPLTLRELRFDVGPSATRFAVVAYDPDEALVVATRLRAPDGAWLDLRGEYALLTSHFYVLGHVAPVLVPGGPQWAGWVQPGAWIMEVATDGERLCHYVLEGEGVGAVLRFDVYLVGVAGRSAATAEDDPALVAMWARFEAVLAQAGLAPARVRYVEVTEDVADALGVISTNDDIEALLRTPRSPGPLAEDQRTVDVFLVQRFGGEMAAAIGVAPSVPGAMGLHGQVGSGLIVSVAELDEPDGDHLVALVLAHELGHFLGLLHTTELNGYSDPLADTPVCGELLPETLTSCPDYANLMFPITTPRDVVISADQAFVLRANPLALPAAAPR